jgi:ABC-type multidrug transport system fused ATPase/permease subunit
MYECKDVSSVFSDSAMHSAVDIEVMYACYQSNSRLLCAYLPLHTGYQHLVVNASTKLHNRAVGTLVHATMSWFESQPTGRVLNRFSKDLQDTDHQLPVSAAHLLPPTQPCVLCLVVI